MQKVRQSGELEARYKSAESETKFRIYVWDRKVQKVRQNSGFMIGVQKCAESETK